MFELLRLIKRKDKKVQLNAESIQKSFDLSSSEFSDLIQKVSPLFEQSGEIAVQPSYLQGRDFDIHISNKYIKAEGVEKNSFRIHLRYKGLIVKDAHIFLIVTHSSTRGTKITGFYSNNTKGGPVEIKGVADILMPLDETISQAAAEHYGQPAVRHVGHANSKLNEKFAQRGFIREYHYDDLDSSEKVYVPTERVKSS